MMLQISAENLPSAEEMIAWAQQYAQMGKPVGKALSTEYCPLAQCFDDLLGGYWAVNPETALFTAARQSAQLIHLPRIYQRIVCLVDDLPQEIDSNDEEDNTSPTISAEEFIAIVERVTQK